MINKQFIKERLNKMLAESGETRHACGVLIKCEETDKVFLLLRNDKVPVWALMSGGIEQGESPMQALRREMHEELRIDSNEIEFKFIRTEHFPDKNFDFHYFEGLTSFQFIPILDHENLDYGWFSKDKLPSPLYKGLGDKIKNI